MTMGYDTTAEYDSAFSTPMSMPMDVLQHFAPMFTDYGGMMGTASSGDSALQGLMKGMSPQTRQGFSADDPAGAQVKSQPQNQLPGPFQKMVPNTPVGMSVSDIGGMPAPANQSAVVSTRTTPTGAEWRPGTEMKSNYSNLRNLNNQAYGVNHGTF